MRGNRSTFGTPPRSFQIFRGIVITFIAIVFCLVIGGICYTAYQAYKGNSNISWGPMGVVEQRCVGGLLYTVDGVANRQVFNEFGKGVPCVK